MRKENNLAKQPTHSDLMKKIEDLEKRLAKLEPRDDLAEYKKLLDEVKKAMPEKEYVPYYPYPYTYPWYSHPYAPPYIFWTTTTCDSGNSYTLTS